MAERGLRFTDHYAGHTVCRPSRLVLWSGLHTGHTPIDDNAPYTLQPEDVTVAQRLQAAGYVTGCVGKWALGNVSNSGHPNRKGFDHFFGYLDQSAAHNYYPPYLWRNIGRSQWFPWVESVPGFTDMTAERIAELVEYMVAKGILWSDNGILAFAPEGENTFGRRNFMDILSVFTSPPLFKVMSGQKELGNVHESTFYRKEEGPAILVLAGRSWKTKHLDWKRRIAHVEPTDEKGRSRWLGEGQMLSHAICQSIRRILASDEDDPAWSRRAVQQFAELRDEHPWVSADATSLVHQPNGQIRWWTFAGGVANALLADALKSHCDVKSDNLSLSFPRASSLEVVSEYINGIQPEAVKPIPNMDAMENLKFSECLSPEIAAEVFTSRFDDRVGVNSALSEAMTMIVER